MTPENGVFPAALKYVAPNLPLVKNPLFFVTSSNKSHDDIFLPTPDKPFTNASSNKPFDAALSSAECNTEASFARPCNFCGAKSFVQKLHSAN